MPSDKKPRLKWRKEYTELLSYSAVGIEMGAAVGIGVLIGVLLDIKVFERRTSPWLTLFFMGLGIIAAFKAFIRAAREMHEKTKDKEDVKRPE